MGNARNRPSGPRSGAPGRRNAGKTMAKSQMKQGVLAPWRRADSLRKRNRGQGLPWQRLSQPSGSAPELREFFSRWSQPWTASGLPLLSSPSQFRFLGNSLPARNRAPVPTELFIPESNFFPTHTLTSLPAINFRCTTMNFGCRKESFATAIQLITFREPMSASCVSKFSYRQQNFLFDVPKFGFRQPLFHMCMVTPGCRQGIGS